MFVPGKSFHPSLMFLGKARSLPEYAASERCVNLTGSGPIAKIRLGWKGLPGTNILAYYEHLQILVIKTSITLSPGVNLIKAFFSS